MRLKTTIHEKDNETNLFLTKGVEHLQLAKAVRKNETGIGDMHMKLTAMRNHCSP